MTRCVLVSTKLPTMHGSKITHELKILVQNPVSKGYWEKNLSSQLIQSAYGYADIEILPVFKISEDADITERIVTPAPKREAQVQQPNLPEKVPLTIDSARRIVT